MSTRVGIQYNREAFPPVNGNEVSPDLLKVLSQAIGGYREVFNSLLNSSHLSSTFVAIEVDSAVSEDDLDKIRSIEGVISASNETQGQQVPEPSKEPGCETIL